LTTLEAIVADGHYQRHDIASWTLGYGGIINHQRKAREKPQTFGSARKDGDPAFPAGPGTHSIPFINGAFVQLVEIFEINTILSRTPILIDHPNDFRSPYDIRVHQTRRAQGCRRPFHRFTAK
jgi:hypothetical protein